MRHIGVYNYASLPNVAFTAATEETNTYRFAKTFPLFFLLPRFRLWYFQASQILSVSSGQRRTLLYLVACVISRNVPRTFRCRMAAIFSGSSAQVKPASLRNLVSTTAPLSQPRRSSHPYFRAKPSR
jgi:hypothetical protein